MREAGCGSRPQAERAIDMHPGARLMGARANFAPGSNAPVFTLPACTQTIVAGGQARQRIDAHPAPIVGRHPHDAPPAEPQHAQCFQDRDVDFLPDDHLNRWRAEQPVFLDVPAGSASSACRAAAMQVKLAIVAPVTKPPAHPGGSLSNSTSQ